MVALTEQMIRGKTKLEHLEDVKNLNLWGQDLEDVSVIASMPYVEVLSLSVNRISSLRDFRHCARLQELYLRKNEISDLSEVQYLTGLQELRVLWLMDNPCAEHPSYRFTVARALPQLQKLDNEEIMPHERGGEYVPPPPGQARPSPYGSPSAAAGGGRPQSSRSAERESHVSGMGFNRRTKNILYAIMALVTELEDEDLVYVKREIDQRLAGR